MSFVRKMPVLLALCPAKDAGCVSLRHNVYKRSWSILLLILNYHIKKQIMKKMYNEPACNFIEFTQGNNILEGLSMAVSDTPATGGGDAPKFEPGFQDSWTEED